MTSRLLALCIGALDPERLARFWAGVLNRAVADDGRTLLPDDSTGFTIVLQSTGEPKVGPNQIHLHLTSTSFDDQQSTVTRVLRLGSPGRTTSRPRSTVSSPSGRRVSMWAGTALFGCSWRIPTVTTPGLCVRPERRCASPGARSGSCLVPA